MSTPNKTLDERLALFDEIVRAYGTDDEKHEKLFAITHHLEMADTPYELDPVKVKAFIKETVEAVMEDTLVELGKVVEKIDQMEFNSLEDYRNVKAILFTNLSKKDE